MVRNIVIISLGIKDSPVSLVDTWTCEDKGSYYLLVFKYWQEVEFGVREINFLYSVNPAVIEDIIVGSKSGNSYLKVTVRKITHPLVTSIDTVTILRARTLSSKAITFTIENRNDNGDEEKMVLDDSSSSNNKKRKIVQLPKKD